MKVRDYTLARSRRKTLCVYITDDASVGVRAPLRMPVREIEAFLAAKSAWIEEKLAVRRRLLAEGEASRPDYGAHVLLRGARYPITAGEGPCGFRDGAFFVPPGLTSKEIARWMADAYRCEARWLILRRADFFAPVLGLKPPEIRISSAKTRWGSCSPSGRLNFSWRLVLARDAAVDYVVVHELCHILRHDHSPQFWALVEAVLPRYREQKAYLRELARELSAQEWI